MTGVAMSVCATDGGGVVASQGVYLPVQQSALLSGLLR